MLSILTRIRNWFEQSLGQGLQSLKEGFLVCTADQKQGPMLKKLVLEVKPGRFMGILPVFGFRQVGSISFSDAIKAPIRTALEAFGRELKQAPKNVCILAGRGLKTDAEKPIGQAQAKVNTEAERLMRKFDEQHLSGMVKADRNGFRQKLLEELGKQASQIFAVAVKKHLVELVLRIRQEAVQDDPSDSADNGVNSLALPTGTRFVVRKGKMTTFVIEQPPQKRTLKIMYQGGDRSNMFQLALPYVVFFIVLRGRKSDGAYVLFRKAPLRDLNDELFCPALPNTFGDFKVCFAPSAAKESLAVMAEESIASFWGGRFIETELVTEAHRQLSIDAWAGASRKDSLFGLSYPWIPAKQTVASMLKKISADFAADTAGQRRERTGKDVMSALDTAVAQLAARVENEMKEACFKLVPTWQVEPALLAQIATEFKRAVGELCGFAKTQLGDQIDEVLSDEALQKALEAAVQQTMVSMKADAERSIAAAHEAFVATLKPEEAK
ncbi:MAG: hypothetical protein AAB391_02425 [Patescibacteria group bacterium]